RRLTMSMGGGAKRAAREQAAATREAAAQTARDNKLKAQAAVDQQAAAIARQQAADQVAAQPASRSTQQVEVNLATENNDSIGTDQMGRRRRPRDVFRSGSSGLNI